ncbi:MULTISPECIES: flagellar hook-length control protein FliK [Deefgea]|uniref:Flagellar hook-length control protein-like C-terminal domain-containing protein n=1 Tax=Deefgea chitinilytica TaxID=570276 RepID=A0ABS2CFB1_9NEIS|nr:MULTISPECIES: flagellar hook-length control protein FliK [Deefgea]MBM5572822.1 hypothetical protein [Deefgea chitinilytica]MBM9890059.1 flagellar hook-length control protein FliK [Deefgea sp. CFH1-16]
MAMSPAAPVQIQAASVKSNESRPQRDSVSRDGDFGREFKRELNRDRTEESRIEPPSKPVAQEKQTASDEISQNNDNAELVQAATVDPWLAMLQGVALNKVNPEQSQDVAQLATDLSDAGGQTQQGDETLALGANATALPAFNLSVSQANTQAQNPSTAVTVDSDATVALADLTQLQTDASDAASIAADAAKFISTQSDAKPAEPLFVNELKTSIAAINELRPQSALNATPANVKSTEVPVHHIATPVGESRWGDAVAQRVGLMLGRQEQKIEMQLNPPNLGPMEVRLNLAQDQASVVFSSQNAAVREALAAAMPKLTTLLADQGFTLTNVQVASDSLQHQQQQQQNQQTATGSGFNQQHAGRDLGGAYGVPAGIDGEKMQELGSMRVPLAKGGVSLFV